MQCTNTTFIFISKTLFNVCGNPNIPHKNPQSQRGRSPSSSKSQEEDPSPSKMASISFSNEQHLQEEDAEEEGGRGGGGEADQSSLSIFSPPGEGRKSMRYLNDRPMRCSSPWQRDPVNRSRGRGG